MVEFSMEMKNHWETVYAKKKPEEVSWFQAKPEYSLAMIQAAEISKDDAIIDVGGGASKLIPTLFELGYRDLTVLDISGRALNEAGRRMGPESEKIRWIEADILKFQPQRTFRFWHDRAVFHFLTESLDKKRYLEVLVNSLSNPGFVMIAAFSLDGPEKCSGLPVQRYSHETLQQTLGSEFQCIRRNAETHLTPEGNSQNFIYSLFQRIRK